MANFLGYTPTSNVSAGGTLIWRNKKARGGQPKFIAAERAAHNGEIFKGGPTVESLQTSSSRLRDGLFLDISDSGEVLGLSWLKK
ncbi:toxin C-terminal domain-containing protein [Saccharothrix violaceirubra]|uniref:toxin C-terminal domain-containing protein n=1 Tax=Saccharothrix violaceirubra TaxID=413306 RepID=UPI001C88BBE7